METTNSNGVAWTALVVAIVALILAWSAYNRAGVDLEDQAAAAVDEAAEEVDQAADEAAQAADEAEDELDEEFVDEDEAGDEVETDASVNVTS